MKYVPKKSGTTIKPGKGTVLNLQFPKTGPGYGGVSPRVSSKNMGTDLDLVFIDLNTGADSNEYGTIVLKNWLITKKGNHINKIQYPDRKNNYFYLSNTIHKSIGGNGNDTMRSPSKPIVSMYGGKGNDWIILNSSVSGVAWLNGGPGNDWIDIRQRRTDLVILTGGAGKDYFLVDNRGYISDVIDFKSGTDKVVLDGSLFGNIQSTTTQNKAGTKACPSKLKGGKKLYDLAPGFGSSDYSLVYNKSNGMLSYKSGASTTSIAFLANRPDLKSTDILVMK